MHVETTNDARPLPAKPLAKRKDWRSKRATVARLWDCVQVIRDGCDCRRINLKRMTRKVITADGARKAAEKNAQQPVTA
jgi:hypothetical protein